MASRTPVFVWTTRSQACLDLLEPVSGVLLARMELIRVLAEPRHQAAIEGLTLAASGWARRVGIRTLDRMGPVQEQTLRQLWSRSDGEDRVEILRLATTPRLHRIALGWLRDVPPAGLRELLFSTDPVWRHPLPPALADAIYPTQELDTELAWATWSRPRSRAWLFAAGPLDLRRLQQRTHQIPATDVLAWFDSHAEALERAVDRLALPPEVLKTLRTDAELLKLAERQLRAEVPLRERFRACPVLESLPVPVALAAIDRAVDDGVPPDLLVGARCAVDPCSFYAWAEDRIVASSVHQLILRSSPRTWPLQHMLQSDDGALRTAALGRVPAHAKRLRKDPDPRVYLLADSICNDAESRQRLRRTAVHGEVGERATAVRYLGELDPHEHRTVLEAALSDREAFDYYLPVAEEAALALARIADPRALTALVRAALVVVHDELSLVLLRCIRLAIDEGGRPLRPVWRAQWSPECAGRTQRSRLS